jgi:hypothetical protein
VTALYKKDVASWLGPKAAEPPSPSPSPSPKASPPPRALLSALSAHFDVHPGICFSLARADVDPAALVALWEACGLAQPGSRAPDRVAASLERCHVVVSAFATDGGTATPGRGKRRGVLVGCARTVWDGAFVSQVVDVAVHPDWCGRGLEGALVRRLLRPAGARHTALPGPLAQLVPQTRGETGGEAVPSAYGAVPSNAAVRDALAGHGFKASKRNVFLQFRGGAP